MPVRKRGPAIQGLVAWALLTLGCSSQTGGEASASVPPPHERSLEGIDPDVAQRIRTALADARAHPDDGTLRGTLGMAYEVGGQPAAAIRCYAEAARLDPTEPKWSYFLALLRGKTGDLDGALVAVDAVTALDESYLPAYLQRGQWLLDAGRDEEARAAYHRATVLDPKSQPAWIGLARVHLRRGEAERAVTILENVAREYPHPYVFQLLALAYRERGDLDAARRLAARAKPGPPPGWPDPWNAEKSTMLAGFAAGLKRAEALIGRGRPGDAIRLLEDLRRDHPDDLVLLNNLSIAYARLGDEARSFDVLTEALELYPDYFPFHLNMANRLAARGDLDGALKHLDRAIELNPTLAFAHRQRGTYLVQAGRPEEALAAYDTALSYDPTDAQTYVAAATLEERLGHRQRAIRRLEQALATDPTLADARRRLERLRDTSG